MSETNYDWEIHSHGDLVEYIQVIFIHRRESRHEIVLFRFKMVAAKATKDQFTQLFTMTLQISKTSASLKRKMIMALIKRSAE